MKSKDAKPDIHGNEKKVEGVSRGDCEKLSNAIDSIMKSYTRLQEKDREIDKAVEERVKATAMIGATMIGAMVIGR